MLSTSDSHTSSPHAIDSAQIDANGQPRFRTPAQAAHPDWPAAAAAEMDGGFSAEIRVFLDQQLTHGDVVLDLNPGFGFVALSAATAPGGMPTVFAHLASEDTLMALQDAAADAGAWIEELVLDAPSDQSSAGALIDAQAIDRLLDSRLEPDGRVFVHLTPDRVVDACRDLSQLCASGRLLALCVSGDVGTERWPEVQAALSAAGLIGCALVERDEDVMLLPVAEPPSSGLIAVPVALFGDADAADAEMTNASDDASDDAFDDAGDDASDDAGDAAPIAEPTQLRTVPSGYDPQRDGLFFIAPHVRTGYGVVGAQLLRALQRLEVPVAFVPNGRVDASLTDNVLIDYAIARRQTLSAHVPSVRLAQAFDLQEHVGEGPRVGFPIFESDGFSAQELEQLRSQDALIVCTEWARQVCLANGLKSVPIHVVPLGVDRTVFHPEVVATSRSTTTTFLQVGKLEPRKGQFELLCAFESAFTPDDDVRLMFACHNPFLSQDMFQMSLAPFVQSPMASRITLITTELASKHDVASLMASADCGVCVSRAEGWNLEALEFLSMGKPLIATHATGHTAFLNSNNARLIAMDALEPAMGGHQPGRWPAWGVRQHEQLVAHLREVHMQRRQGSLAVNTAGIVTASMHTWDDSAAALLAALKGLA